MAGANESAESEVGTQSESVFGKVMPSTFAAELGGWVYALTLGIKGLVVAMFVGLFIGLAMLGNATPGASFSAIQFFLAWILGIGLLGFLAGITVGVILDWLARRNNSPN